MQVGPEQAKAIWDVLPHYAIFDIWQANFHWRWLVWITFHIIGDRLKTASFDHCGSLGKK